ncbi:hypothetical protein [Pseudomonas sp. TWI929]|uniref:hypothetical protein n=1 Tax=Pseudomonas sp. TWI929 TaxID=3136795 RepID=UPI00320B14CF
MTIDKEHLKALAEACAPSKCADEAEEGRRLAELYSECEPEHILALLEEIEHLKGLQPAMPPRPPEGGGLPRFGLRWNGPQQPLAVPMEDGYWTPWHLAERLREDRDGLLEAGAHLL